MSDNVTSNTALKEALLQVKGRTKESAAQEVRVPVNIPVGYRNKLKVIAAVEDTTMKALILEALELLFDNRAGK